MDIPINANVYCTDDYCGQTACVIIHPTTKDVTHVVVKSKYIPHEEYLVPIESITQATPQAINLKYSQAELVTLDKFVEHEFIHVNRSMGLYPADRYAMWPYVLPQDQTFLDIVHERVPNGESALHRGAQVEAADGPVGKVDEFLIEPKDGRITHLVLRHGHLWGKKDVVIPVSAINEIIVDTIYLKLNQKEIEAMPTIPIKRWWQ